MFAASTLAARGRPRSDYELAPKLLNGTLELLMRAEASAIGRGVRLPAGVSIGIVCTAA